MKIAIEGCAHGELDKIYEAIEHLQKKEGIKVDLLICCGDFQSTRNLQDLKCMAVPPKYQDICSFYKYFSGEKTTPILTIFVGGNHEASNYLQELPYGGWVAPNVYYMGYAGVVNIAGVRIAGISGIYKFHDFLKGHYEKPPYSEETKRSAYHIRNVEVFRLKQVQEPIDIFLSHDWPSGVYNHGNTAKLLKRKPYFADDMTSNRLGSKPCEELLHHLKPAYWFAAHLHVKFAALIPHPEDNENKKAKVTKFLALDKCLPRRQFLQILDIPHDEEKPMNLEYDLEWLTVLFMTNHLTSIKKSTHYMPGEGHDSRWNFTPTNEEKETVRLRMGDDLTIPKNFAQTVAAYDPNTDASPQQSTVSQPKACTNPQTTELCKRLGIDDPMAMLLESSNDEMNDSMGTPHRHSHSWSNRILISPEYPGEISFVSTNDDEDDVNSDNLKNTSGTADKSLSFSPPFLGRMSLPTPRNTDTSSLEDEPSLSTTNTSIDGSEVSPSKVKDEEVKEDFKNDNLREDVTQKSSTTNRTIGPKKFKRRNESLYAEDDD